MNSGSRVEETLRENTAQPHILRHRSARAPQLSPEVKLYCCRLVSEAPTIPCEVPRDSHDATRPLYRCHTFSPGLRVSAVAAVANEVLIVGPASGQWPETAYSGTVGGKEDSRGYAGEGGEGGGYVDVHLPENVDDRVALSAVSLVEASVAGVYDAVICARRRSKRKRKLLDEPLSD